MKNLSPLNQLLLLEDYEREIQRTIFVGLFLLVCIGMLYWRGGDEQIAGLSAKCAGMVLLGVGSLMQFGQALRTWRAKQAARRRANLIDKFITE